MESLKKGKTWKGEFIVRRKNGDKFLAYVYDSPILDKDGNLLGVIGISTDITEKKEIENALKFHAILMRNIHDSVLTTDKDFRITSWNKGAEAMYGWKSKEVLGKKESDVLKTEFPDIKDELTWQKALAKVGHWRGEAVQFRKDGTKIPILASLAVIKDTKGNILGGISVNRDISDRKLFEQRKDEFLSMASHELKTPVTSIKTYAQLLTKRLTDKKDTQNAYFVQNIEKQTKKLTTLIEDFLDVSKIEAGKLQYSKKSFDLDALIKRIVADFQLTTDSHFIQRIGEVNTKVYGDEDRIGQVLINLLVNAIKYSPSGGDIVVQTKATKAYVTLSVRDFGIGIPKEKQKHIFEKFVQAAKDIDTVKKGLGLGLYISAEIIKRHKGKMWVESKVGKGSTFYFSLPNSKK